MADKYIFDKKKMEFRKVTHSVGWFLRKGLKYFLVTASISVIYYIAFALLVNTDTERQLKRQNQMYRQLYSEMSRREELVSDVLEGLKAKDNDIYRQIFSADAPELGMAYSGDFLSRIDSVEDKDIVEYVSRKLDILKGQTAAVDEDFRKISEVLGKGQESLPPLSSPLESFNPAKAGASVGDKVNPFYKVPAMHTGLDMISPQGTEVLASAAGVVREVTKSAKGLGNVVSIDHGNGYTTRYAHLDDIKVSSGQRVQKGKLIGHVGMSGNSFAPHLHYEVLKDTVRVDPLHCFFASVGPEEYAGMLFMSANTAQSLD